MTHRSDLTELIAEARAAADALEADWLGAEHTAVEEFRAVVALRAMGDALEATLAPEPRPQDIPEDEREALVTKAYNTVTGQDDDWNPDKTLEALHELYESARRQSPFTGGDYYEGFEEGFAAARGTAVTQDEREALTDLLMNERDGWERHYLDMPSDILADAIIAAGFRRQAPLPEGTAVTQDELEALIQEVDDEDWSNIFPEEGRQIAVAMLAKFNITHREEKP